MLIGGAGYIGSALLPKLMALGHYVCVVDAGWFGTSHIDPPELHIYDAASLTRVS
ncbi:NAD-dependent epimerase/dehydratase family protein, partial [Bordetella holmesii]|uniref:NAD-dependent epimerase/dehydratase family protein n=1 Tax=Bordetella holmesii TaxID=35814 RepID=UPI0034E0CCC2